MQAAHGECPKVRPRLCCALCAIKPPANFGVNATFFNETPKGPIEGLPLMGPFFIIYALDLPSVFEKKSIHMSTRNPMNDRYQTDGPKGQTKKSASSLKPKSKAASSVYVKSTQKTPQEKKAAQKAARQKQAELDRKYYNPPTAQYKKYKRIWWGMLGGAIVCTLVAMGAGSWWPDNPNMTWCFLIPAYALIIGALWFDFAKVRKVRREYQMEMLKKHPKEAKKHPTTAAKNKIDAAKEAEREAAKAEKKRFGHSFIRKAKSEETAEGEKKSE